MLYTREHLNSKWSFFEFIINIDYSFRLDFEYSIMPALDKLSGNSENVDKDFQHCINVSKCVKKKT